MSDQNLEFVTPLARTLQIDGKSLSITPLTVSEMPGFVRSAEPFLAEMIYSANAMDAAQLIAMIGQHGDALIDAVAMATRQDRAWVGALLVDRLVAIALVAVEVNQDFFSRALPQMRGMLEKLAPSLAVQLSKGSTTPKPSTA